MELTIFIMFATVSALPDVALPAVELPLTVALPLAAFRVMLLVIWLLVVEATLGTVVGEAIKLPDDNAFTIIGYS